MIRCVFCSQLEEELSGVVEVVGMVSNKGVLMAATYNLLREDRGTSFGGSPVKLSQFSRI